MGKLILDSIDHGQAFDWGKTSEDYVKFRCPAPCDGPRHFKALPLSIRLVCF